MLEKTPLFEYSIALLIGCVFALLGHFWPALSQPLGPLYAGCIAFLVASFFILLHKSSLISADLAAVKSILFNSDIGIISNDDSLMSILWLRTYLLAKEDSGKSGYSITKNGALRIDAEEPFRQFWLACIRCTKVSWLCTNYVNQEESWTPQWQRLGLAYQKLQTSKELQVGPSPITIQRLFIYDREEDPREYLKMMREHGDSFDVKWVFSDVNFGLNKKLKDLAYGLGTFDIAIIDGRFLIAFILQGKSHVRAEVYADPGIIQTKTSLFTTLWGDSFDLDEFNNTDEKIGT